MELQAQVKINHWQTKGYVRHKAFDELYGGLVDLTDTFAEAAMGKYGRFTLENDDKTLNIVNLTELDLNEVLPLNTLFSVWDTYYNSLTKDLYFVGIKKGDLYFDTLEKYVDQFTTNTSCNIKN